MDLLEEILALSLEARAARIADLTDEELASVLQAAQARFTEVDGAEHLTDEILASMADLDVVIATVATEQTGREEHQTELEQRAAEIRARVNGDGDAEAEETTEEAEPEVETPPVAPTGTETETPEQIAASTTPPVVVPAPSPVRSPHITDINARRPAARRPRPQQAQRSRSVIRASGDATGFASGEELTALQLGQAFATKASHVMAGGMGGRFGVFRNTLEVPDDRVVSMDFDPMRNGAIIAAAHGAGDLDELLASGIGLEALMSPMTPDSLLAAGGLCGPLDTDWGQGVISSAERPIRDFLGHVLARRGGMRYMRPPVISDTESASVIWTAANDANPSNPATKPCLTVSCGTIIEDLVYAVPLCLQIGNFEARTFPERFRAWWQTAQAQQARLAESKMLSLIAASSITVAVTDDNNLGAARDILEVYRRRAAQLRYQYRLPEAFTFDVMLPRWARQAMIADLIREIPGSTDERLATSNAKVDTFVAAAGLNVLWFADARIADQAYPAETGGALEPWRGIVEGYIFAPGTFTAMDAGTLDLGMDIRDSEMNSLNNVRAFIETFEGIAATGIHCTQIRNEICVNGASGGTVALTCTTTGGS